MFTQAHHNTAREHSRPRDASVSSHSSRKNANIDLIELNDIDSDFNTDFDPPATEGDHEPIVTNAEPKIGINNTISPKLLR